MTRTQVGIVGGGPSALMLACLLHDAGIDSIVVDIRPLQEIRATERAGILEQGTVELLRRAVGDRVVREGSEHEGIMLAFGGRGHRIDFRRLVNASVQLYPQTEVFIDLADACTRRGIDMRYGVREVSVHDLTGNQPGIRFTDDHGVACEVRCDYLVGADGGHSMCRHSIPRESRHQYFREYPFAWFGIMCRAPCSAPELIYSHSERGFALISQRNQSLQRMYFQCNPNEAVEAWSSDRIWSELQARVGANGFRLQEGPITEKVVLPFRSFVLESMRYGHLVLVGDAVHTGPPTGAKWLNLALHDAQILAETLIEVVAKRTPDLLDEYPRKALERIWKVQSFSYWMTQMLHRSPDDSDFDMQRQLGELHTVADSERGAAYLAHCYTGWPG